MGLRAYVKQGDVVDLGDWEYCEADSGLFVMPGVYTYGKIDYDETGARTIKSGRPNYAEETPKSTTQRSRPING